MRRTFSVLGMVCVWLIACASAPAVEPTVPEVTLATIISRGGIAFSETAKRQSDSAWSWANKHRTETAMCVSRYAFGVSVNHHPFVLILKFSDDSLPISHRDSLRIDYTGGTVCGDSLPSWHAHIVSNSVRFGPSECDKHFAADRPKVPFHLVQGGPDTAAVYGPDPRYADTTTAWCR